MFPSWFLYSILIGYLCVLFGVALVGDRLAKGQRLERARPWVYALALAVYCTSWTFYGAVGRASVDLWSYLPIYLGPIAVFVFGAPLVRRIVEGVQRHHLTSVADYLAFLYGRDRLIATLATLVCVVAVVPYIALQLKGVTLGFDVLADRVSGEGSSTPALFTALILAAFAILFGTRHVSSRESHQGLLVAIAFESLVKLIAFLVVGLLCVYALEPIHWAAFTRRLPASTEGLSSAAFGVQTLLAAVAILCLPRQFHVTAVEYNTQSDLARARWLFPAYLALVAALVLPIVVIGPALLGARTNPDTFVLLVPIALNQPEVSLLVFIGGVSAASAMVIVSSIALSTMIGNEIVIPQVIGANRIPDGPDYLRLIQRTRRVTIAVIIALAYAFYHRMAEDTSLASTGLLAFVGIAQLAPAMLAGLYWSSAGRLGAVGGLIAGALAWLWMMVVPTLHPAAESWFVGEAWQALGPANFFGLGAYDAVTRAAVVSLGINVATLVAVSLWETRRRDHRLRPDSVRGGDSVMSAADAGHILGLFFGPEQAGEALAPGGVPLPSRQAADRCERLLSGVMGAATARRLMRQYTDTQAESVDKVLEHTSQVVEFSRELLLASLDNISAAVSVVDANQRLVAWNRLYQELFGFSDELLIVGMPIERLVRHNAERGLLGAGDSEDLVGRRLEHMRVGTAYRHERELPDGRFLEIRGAPMPGGGFITSFTDVSDYKQMQLELEQRVHQRTSELERANAALSAAKVAADDANQSKTRFLAAATHDLMQPLNAARLFSSVMMQGGDPDRIRENAAQIERSLDGMEVLLGTLMDISKLDTGHLPTRIVSFPVQELLATVSEQFGAEAKTHAIRLDVKPCGAIIRSDAAHLLRILSNFVSNALRYSGPNRRVLVGCRRIGDTVRIEVLDNGPGISEDKRELIFQEFQRGAADTAFGPRGSGLGLSISRRLAALLGHDLTLRTVPGRGSAFCIAVPRVNQVEVAHPTSLSPIRTFTRRFDGLRVLCVDNEAAVLDGMRALLESWGCACLLAEDLAGAMATVHADEPPDIALIDYHLDNGASGIEVLIRLRANWGKDVPAILITADYTNEARIAAEAACVPLMRKPVKPGALGAMISRMQRRNGRGEHQMDL